MPGRDGKKYRYETSLTDDSSVITEYEMDPETGKRLSRKELSITDESGTSECLSIRFMKFTDDPYEIESVGFLVPRELARRAFYWAARGNK